MKVAVCIATYRRPDMLASLLRSLAEMALEPPAPEIVIVVVDNDTRGEAERVIDTSRPDVPWRIVSAVEPTRSIALTRNRCVALALADGVDWAAFVDDDETVSPRWLDELLRVQAASRADIVAGPVENVYPDGAPGWIVAAGRRARPRLPANAESPVAETSNALVSRRVLEQVTGPFEPQLGLSGGSDSLFFLRARLAGARIVWASDAVVCETIPSSRATAEWLLRRAFRTGNCAVFVARAALPLHRWLPRRLAGACYRLTIGILGLVPALAQGRAGLLGALQNVCIGAGALAALGGYRYVEYQRSHGA
jgi:succinoglycan biosynthesis protein ExoM